MNWRYRDVMQAPPDDTDASGRLPTGGRHWWLIRAALLIAGVALAAIASGVLLVGGWGESIPPSAAAYRVEPVEVFEAAAPQQVATPTTVERATASPTPTAGPTAQPTPKPLGVDGPLSNAEVVPTSRPAATATPRPATISPEFAPESTAPPPALSTPTSPPPPAPPTSTPVPPPPSCPSAAITGYASTPVAAINQ